MGVLSGMFRKPSVKQASFRLTDKGSAQFEKNITTGDENTLDAYVLLAITDSGSQSLNSLESRLRVGRDRIERSLERLARNRCIAPVREPYDY